MEFLLPLVLVGIFAVALLSWWYQEKTHEEKKKVRQEVKDNLLKLVNQLPKKEWQHADSVFVDITNKKGETVGREAAWLALDKARGEILIAWTSQQYPQILGDQSQRLRSVSGIWGKQDILNVQLAVNEEKTSISSGKIEGNSGQSLLGTLLFGVAGGVVGASGSRRLNSESYEETKVLSLALEIQLSDPETPYIYIHFFFADIDYSKFFDDSKADKRLSISIEDLRSTDSFTMSQKWYSLFTDLMNTKSIPKTDCESVNLDVVEQLEKLQSMLSKGLIDEKEYVSAKDKILNPNPRT